MLYVRVERRHLGTGSGFKGVYQLLNLKALKCWALYKTVILQCIYKIFLWSLKGYIEMQHVVTVYHQTNSHVLRAFSLFCRGMPLLNWYKKLYMGNLSDYQMHFFGWNLWSVSFLFTIWDAQAFFIEDLLWLEPYCLYVCLYQGCP